MSDRNYAILAIACLLGVPLAPVAAYRLTAVALRPFRVMRRWRGTAAGLAGLCTMLTISPLLFLMAVCSGPRPGESDRALATRERGTVYIREINAYRQAHGEWPATLRDLAADAHSDTTSASTASGEPYPLQYERDSLGYRLHFEYTGPGMNNCESTARRPKWFCHGYF